MGHVIEPGFVTGLVMEAECLTDVGCRRVGCVGPGFAHAGRCARRLVEDGARGLVSFGLAGGLDPRLPSGTVLLADRVIAGAVSLDTAVIWRDSLERQLTSFHPVVGAVVDSSQVVATVTGKQALFAASGAAAVDMESAAVAQVAAAAGLPFVAVRVIADPALRDLPGAALAGMGEDGRVRPMAVLAALLRHPFELPDLLRLSLDSARATAVLRRVGGVVGVGATGR
ncbi:MAG: hypothetical protein HQL37_06445 [Alphaproteobacteria bacterium]|nr:hypothetical protein [Alphaproteobacteria bacterium]